MNWHGLENKRILGTVPVESDGSAYFDMFHRFGYPISDRLKKEMWILDFGLADFSRVGMAGIFWLNRQDYNYFGHEIYLLPGQMIPEHKHLATDKGRAKMESWQPRHGMIYTFGNAGASRREAHRTGRENSRNRTTVLSLFAAILRYASRLEIRRELPAGLGVRESLRYNWPSWLHLQCSVAVRISLNLARGGSPCCDK